MKATMIYLLGLLFLCALCFSCQKKKQSPQQPNAVSIQSASVSVDSISPDTAVVVTEDTTITLEVVTDGTQPKDSNRAH